MEYGGGGPVVRYEHLMDVHNNTFRVLRLIDPTEPAGRKKIPRSAMSPAFTLPFIVSVFDDDSSQIVGVFRAQPQAGGVHRGESAPAFTFSAFAAFPRR